MGVCSQKKFQKEFAGRKSAPSTAPEYKKNGVCGSMRSTKIGGV